MKVLILTHFYWPESFAAANRVTAFAEYLAANGHAVTVATCFPNYPTGKIFLGYRNKWFFREKHNGVSIQRTFTYVPGNAGKLSRLLSYISVSMLTFLRLAVSAPRADVVIFSSPPLLWGTCAYGLSLLHRWPLVVDVRDVWPEVGVLLGGMRKHSIGERFFRHLSALLYRKAVAITVTNPAKRRLIGMGYKIPLHKMSVIWNGMDEYLLDVKGNSLRAARSDGKGRSFSLLFAGLIGVAQGVGQIVEAARLLRDRKDFHFLLVGDGTEKQAIADMVKMCGLRNVSFQETVPREDIPSYYRAADACIVPLRSEALRDSFPSKIFEAMGLGCPVVLCAARDSDAARLVSHSGGGVVVQPGNARALAGALEHLRKDPALRRSMSSKGRAHVLKHYMRQKMCSAFEETIRRALVGRTRVSQ